MRFLIILAGLMVMAFPVRAEDAKLTDGLAQIYEAPEFAGISEWKNSEALTMAGLKGKVVLVDFWTYSCINCIRTLPYLTGWDKKYRDQGLVLIGVHSPEFGFERMPENVGKAIEKYGIQYPVAIDSNQGTWNAFKNQYWPAEYLINKDGRVVYTHFGEGHYDVTENNIRALLGLSAETPVAETTSPIAQGQTPETYLGYDREKAFAEGALVHDKPTIYHVAKDLELNKWTLNGEWTASGQKITAGKDAILRLNFQAKKVFLVLGSATGQPVKADVILNGAAIGDAAGEDVPGGVLTVDNHRLYELVSQSEFKPGVMQINVKDAGLEAYAFTFGN